MATLTHILLFSSALLFFSCDASKKATENEQIETTDNGKPQRQEFATIQKSYCYGKCPVYKITIYEDGRTILEGKANLDMIGVWELKLDLSELDAFTKMARNIGYMELEDKYDSEITDIPSTTTSILIDGVRKEVCRRANYPEKILKFEALFTDLLGREGWTQIGELGN